MGRPKKGGGSSGEGLEASLAAADDVLAGALVRLRDRPDRTVHSTGHPFVDYVMGAEPPGPEFPNGRPGGLVRGLQIEIFGAESGGKTYLATQMGIAAMRADPTVKVAFVDAERCFALPWFEQNGGGPFLDRFAVVEPDSGEAGLEYVGRLAQEKRADIIIVDSVAALVPERETIDAVMDPKSNSEMGGGQIGLHARMMSQALRALVPVCGNNNVTIIWINQTRVGMKKIMGKTTVFETTTGGNALKFYCAVRLAVRKIKSVTTKLKHPFTGEQYEETRAIQSNIRCVKNKVGIPGREAVVTFALRRGYDLEYDTLVCAIANGWIKQKGSWYDLGDFTEVAGTDKTQGLTDLYALLQQKEAFRTALVNRVINIAISAEKIDTVALPTALSEEEPDLESEA